jgi:GDPmannose 4,6-dehydratase
MPRAFITGITGQDGSYLAGLLLEKGYEVHGGLRRGRAPERSPLRHLWENPSVRERRLFLHEADLTNPAALAQALNKADPDEVYHLAGQSHVGRSFAIPERTTELIALATVRLLELLRRRERPPRLFHASSSEIFGRPAQSPQTETTPVAPVNPYGCAKAFAHRMVTVYREAHGLFACNGILFNHESPRRGEDFVTRKICRAAAAIARGRQRELRLGNLDARRDWGHARDYVRAMWLMLQQPGADDYVIATGETHSVREVVELAFAEAGLDWRRHVKTDPRFFRPTEPFTLVGDAAKARDRLGWRPETGFATLIREMTRAELRTTAP